MRPVVPFTAAALLALAGGVASAQGYSYSQGQGPLLLAPGANGNSYSYDLSTGAPLSATTVPQRYSPYVTMTAPQTQAGASDWRLQHAATWYRNLFGREPSSRDYAKWADHYRRGGTTEEVLVSLLAGDEYWDQTGRNFMDWFMASALMSGNPVTPQQAAQWHQVYRQNPDRDALLHRFFDTTGTFRQERAVTGNSGPELPSDPSPYRGYPGYRSGLGYGDASYGRPGVPWYADDATRYGQYGAGYSGRYSTGYRGYYNGR